MTYTDGEEAMLGDEVLIDGQYKGRVLDCIDLGQYSVAYPESEWAYLREGILVDTDFGGLIHYKNAVDEHMVMVKRGAI